MLINQATGYPALTPMERDQAIRDELYERIDGGWNSEWDRLGQALDEESEPIEDGFMTRHLRQW